MNTDELNALAEMGLKRQEQNEERIVFKRRICLAKQYALCISFNSDLYLLKRAVRGSNTYNRIGGVERLSGFIAALFLAGMISDKEKSRLYEVVCLAASPSFEFFPEMVEAA